MKKFYFTFGVNQKILKNYYVVISADFEDEAREVMRENFGNHWSWCYNENDWKKEDLSNKFNNKELIY